VQSITSDVVIVCIDTFVPNVVKRTVIVVDQGSIHTCDALQDKLEEWNERQIEIFQLPSYSAELNLIEILTFPVIFFRVKPRARSRAESLIVPSAYVNKIQLMTIIRCPESVS
jgi:hypothetical protein